VEPLPLFIDTYDSKETDDSTVVAFQRVIEQGDAETRLSVLLSSSGSGALFFALPQDGLLSVLSCWRRPSESSIVRAFCTILSIAESCSSVTA
jgi:hypothetical protein